MIVVDGASGEAVKNAVNSGKAQNIRAMMDNSMYTFEGLADSRLGLDKMSVERGWANLLTGTTAHQVGVQNEYGEVNGVDKLETPSFLKRLKETKDGLKVSLYAFDTAFHDVFGRDADKKQIATTDNDTKDAVIAEINAQSSVSSDVIVIQFGNVNKTGEEKGFWENEYAPTEDVIDAIGETDRYIGEILKVLETRPDYVQENWLVVITSSYGGAYDGNTDVETLYLDPRLNTFSMMYNSRFSPKLLQKPSDDELLYNFYSPYFVGPGQRATTNAVMTGNTEFFNMGKRYSSDANEKVDTNSYTIHFRMIDYHNDPWGHRNILSKRYGTSGEGWQIRYSSNTYVEFYSNNRNGNFWITSATRRDGEWHSYTVVIKECGSTQYADSMFFYLDGALNTRCRINGDAAMWTDAPLVIGHIYSPDRPSQAKVIINDLQFYNVALPADFIAANHCATELDLLGEEYEYWDELVGYYPNDREEDAIYPYLKDYSKYASNNKRLYFNKPVGSFVPSDNYVTRERRGITSDNICPNIDESYYRAVISTVDLSYQVFMWFGTPIDMSWNLEGTGWPVNYDYMD
jgi:hypothetical protein